MYIITIAVSTFYALIVMQKRYFILWLFVFRTLLIFLELREIDVVIRR